MQKDHFFEVYASQAAQYHRLIEPEDADRNLLPALEQITSFKNKRVLDLGTGTGRLPLLIGQQARQLVCLDLHGDMLRENRRQRERRQGQWRLIQGDMSALPLPDRWADVITAGWAIGHVTGWYPKTWTEQAGRMLREMHRLVAPGGALIIIETLTTGSLTPAPPSEPLAQYYAWLEQEWSFTRQEIRTDYEFASAEEAAAQAEFFFGSRLTAVIREQGWARIPEWTGVWSKVDTERKK